MCVLFLELIMFYNIFPDLSPDVPFVLIFVNFIYLALYETYLIYFSYTEDKVVLNFHGNIFFLSYTGGVRRATLPVTRLK